MIALQVIENVIKCARYYLREIQLLVLLPEQINHFLYYTALNPIRIVIRILFSRNGERSNGLEPTFLRIPTQLFALPIYPLFLFLLCIQLLLNYLNFLPNAFLLQTMPAMTEDLLYLSPSYTLSKISPLCIYFALFSIHY